MHQEKQRPPGQKSHWDETFAKSAAFFGEEASGFAKLSLDLFRRNGVGSLLEIGCGQGRDALLFASNAIEVTAVDYSETALADLTKIAAQAGLSSQIHVRTHDVREPLPFADASFDACYSHMLLCMELSTAEIAFILREIHRILKPGGLTVYSVRSNFDKHYRAGTHLREDIFAIGGFVVHFFTEQKIRQLAKGYELLQINRIEEGSLPRDLFCVTMKKEPVEAPWDLLPCEEQKTGGQFNDVPVVPPGKT